MIPADLLRIAAAEYLCNVFECLAAGEGRALTAREIMHIKLQYPGVEAWYSSLAADRQVQLLEYLNKKAFPAAGQTSHFAAGRGCGQATRSPGSLPAK